MSRTIDAHQHFWDPGRADYPWMAGDALAPIRRPFGPADLAPLLAENGLDASILVQTRSCALHRRRRSLPVSSAGST